MPIEASTSRSHYDPPGSDSSRNPCYRILGRLATLSYCAAVIVLATPVVAGGASLPLRTVLADLQLRTGGGLTGPVVDHTQHGVVIVRDGTPYVFAWEELESGCAFRTKRALLALERDGEEKFTAEDHFQLGLFALRHGRNDLAANEFNHAKRLSPAYRSRVRSAFKELPRHEVKSSDELAPFKKAPVIDPPRRAQPAEPVESSVVEGLKRLSHMVEIASVPLEKHRAEVLEVYKAFGAKVQEVIGSDVALIESDHFLIWTDWRGRDRDRLVGWCEAMYAALCVQFHLDPTEDVFLAKCPLFCWSSKARFQQFARHFDGYDGINAVGYTRSIPESGHVHVALLKQGRSDADLDRFACTLVHEGTHAFLHRLYSSRLIPHWINEGYADLMAERVLGDRCPTGENAALLARQIVRYDWPLGELLQSVDPIEIHQYPAAHSVVAYLVQRGADRFTAFIRALKNGDSVNTALGSNYDNLTLDQLELRWRAAVREADPKARPQTDASRAAAP